MSTDNGNERRQAFSVKSRLFNFEIKGTNMVTAFLLAVMCVVCALQAVIAYAIWQHTTETAASAKVTAGALAAIAKKQDQTTDAQWVQNMIQLVDPAKRRELELDVPDEVRNRLRWRNGDAYK